MGVRPELRQRHDLDPEPLQPLHREYAAQDAAAHLDAADLDAAASSPRAPGSRSRGERRQPVDVQPELRVASLPSTKRWQRSGESSQMRAMRTVDIQGSMNCPIDFEVWPGGGKNYNHALPVDSGLFLSYFTPLGAHCGRCGRPVNLWECVRETLTAFGGTSDGGSAAASWKPLEETAGALGLPGKALKVIVPPDSATQVNLAEWGLPSTAKILSINLTPEGTGDIWPTQLLQQRVMGEPIAHTITLFPWARPGSKFESPLKVNVWVLWVDESFVAPSFVHLVDALIHYTHNEFEKCVRSGQLAIEEPLTDLVPRAFKAKGGLSGTVDRLLSRRNYRDVVEELLPSIAEDLGLPKMPGPLLTGIKKLMRLRNQTAHRATAAVTETDARDGLMAALFGLYYALYFDELLKGIASTNGSPPAAV